MFFLDLEFLFTVMYVFNLKIHMGGCALNKGLDLIIVKNKFSVKQLHEKYKCSDMFINFNSKISLRILLS